MRALFFYAMGVLFGWVLSRSGAGDYDVVQAMFLFEHEQLYGIIGVAVVVLVPTFWLLRRSSLGERLPFPSKPVHRGNLVGGALFGVGWALTGMCPGPIFVNLGEGKLYALPALAGALLGAALFGVLQPRLQRSGWL